MAESNPGACIRALKLGVKFASARARKATKRLNDLNRALWDLVGCDVPSGPEGAKFTPEEGAQRVKEQRDKLLEASTSFREKLEEAIDAAGRLDIGYCRRNEDMVRAASVDLLRLDKELKGQPFDGPRNKAEAERDALRAERDALRAERDALKAELASLKAWHPASEPPPVDTMVLVINADDQDDTVGADMFRWSGWVNSYTVTHWREMPPKPEVNP